MRCCIIFLILCLLFPLLARAQGERILDFHSDITVRPDAELLVAETIRVRAENLEIRRGIYRDFPTTYRDRLGNQVNIRFQVLDVERDGAPEPYHTENLRNGVRVYIGSPDVFVSTGVHTYVLRYQVNRELGFFEDHDELYWNVTGNGWVFPIDHAGAVVILPDGIPAEDIHVEAYTGPQGAKGQDYRAEVNANGQAVFSTTAPLNSYEGLTIVVAFPKGYVTPPSAEQRTRWLLQDNLALLIGLAGLVVLLGYFITVWAFVGRDLPRGTIIPLFAPPAGMSPAAVRYVWRMGYDVKALSAALINTAIKGYLTITQGEGFLSSVVGAKYTIQRTGKAPVTGKAPDALSSEEARLLAVLLPHGSDSLELSNTNHSIFQQAITAVKTDLKAHAHFITNTHFFVPGVLLSLLVLALTFYGYSTGYVTEEAIGGLLFTGVPLFIFIIAGSSFIARIRYGSAAQRLFSILGLLFLFLFCSVFFVVAFFFLRPPYALLLVAVAVIGIDTLFYHLLKAPTMHGRNLLDAIEGFRMYLTVAEEDRLNAMHPPERTPELFERFLPYALALDAEQAWAERFTDVLRRAEIDHQPYRPAWYAGSAWSVSQPATFADAMGSSLSGAISSSSTAPGSSSGSGGGGSSGGGGGGGGGGGW
jgi:uncharacterized membrane protein YgcG